MALLEWIKQQIGALIRVGAKCHSHLVLVLLSKKGEMVASRWITSRETMPPVPPTAAAAEAAPAAGKVNHGKVVKGWINEFVHAMTWSNRHW
jgi:hypothetical protein